MRATRPYTYLGTVQGMCRECRALVPARVLEQGGAVYQEALCPACGPGRARIADGVAWYLDRMRTVVEHVPPFDPAPVRQGCPGDCGPCAFHVARCQLPVISVTNACNLRCPICFTYNRREPAYFMEADELARILDTIALHAGPVDLINITGGEPTLHPRILSLLEQCRREGIGRVTMNSNGLRLAAEPDLCRELAARGAYCILSLHTLRPEVSVRMHGRDITAEKRRALENLGRAEVGTTLLMVLGRGVNEPDARDLLALAKSYDHVRSLTVQTMTYTGQGGRSFGPREHLPLDGAARILEATSGGEIRAAHFVPHPRAHPLCYSVAYYLRGATGLRSFTEFLTVDELRRLLSGGYLISGEGDAAEILKTALDRLWANEPDSQLLPRFRRMLERLYPTGTALSRFERQRVCEEDILTVYLHAHMDEDTFDLGRLVACADQVPDRHGRLVPACAYNLFHRMQDPRFFDPSEAAAGGPRSAAGRAVWGS